MAMCLKASTRSTIWPGGVATLATSARKTLRHAIGLPGGVSAKSWEFHIHGKLSTIIAPIYLRRGLVKL